MLEYIICGLIAFLIGAAIAFPTGVNYRKKIAEKELGTAENEAKKIVSDAINPLRARRKRLCWKPKTKFFK
jgi:ribonuclease Y